MKTLSIAFLGTFMCFSFLCASSPAHAEGIFIEPYLGYETGELDYGTSDDDTRGLVYGFRLGYLSGDLGVGVEYDTGSVEVDSNPDDDFLLKDQGAFISYNLGAARIWGTYIFSAKGELDDAGTKYESGSGARFGIGFVGANNISFNIEKIERFYKKVGNISVSPKREIDALVFSVSLQLP